MKRVLGLIMIISSTSVFANTTNIKYVNDIFSKLSDKEYNDIKKASKDFSFQPSHKDPATGTQLFKITKVVKGSLFEKVGLKVGDLIANGNAPTTKVPIKK